MVSETLKKANDKLNGFAPAVLVLLNILLVALVTLTGFFGSDIWYEQKVYPNSVIKRDMQKLDEKVNQLNNQKAEDHRVDVVFEILRTKADKENIKILIGELKNQYENTKERLNEIRDEIREQMRCQNDKIDELNRYLRNTSNEF